MTPARTLRTTWEPILVWIVWVCLLANLLRFVAHYGSEVMLMDDLSETEVLLNPNGLTWEYLWGLHNEHRLPLPKLIQHGLYSLTGDIRSGSYFTILLLAAAAVGGILTARKIRGRTIWTDAFFPLLLMDTGNSENLLMGFQLTLMLATAIVCGLLYFAAAHERRLRWKTALALGLAILALPLCGGPGVLQTPALCLWLAALSWRLSTSEIAANRRAGWILCGAVLATFAVLVSYMIGFAFPEGAHHGGPLLSVLDRAATVLVHALGVAGCDARPWSAWFVALLTASSLGVALAAYKSRPDERWRAGGVMCCLIANLCLALGIAWGRIGTDAEQGCAMRYIGLTAPTLVAAYLSWTLYGKAVPRAIVQASLCVVPAVAFATSNHAAGEEYGRQRHLAAEGLQRDIAAEVPAWKIIDTYAPWVDTERFRFCVRFTQLARAGIVPFDRVSNAVRDAFLYADVRVRPRQTTGFVIPDPRSTGPDDAGLLAFEGANLYFQIPSTASTLHGSLAVPPEPRATREGAAVHFLVYLRTKDRRKVLLERTLDPAHNEADRGTQRFTLDVSHSPGADLVLRIVRDPSTQEPSTWGWWGPLSFE